MIQREPETALYETWARDFDIVVAEQYPGHAAPHHPGLDRATLTSDAIRLATPPIGLGGESISSLADTAALPWVMEPRGAASRHWAEQACRSAGFEPDVRYETADLQAQIRLIESGNAVALMPDLVWTGRTTPVAAAGPPRTPQADSLHLDAHRRPDPPGNPGLPGSAGTGGRGTGVGREVGGHPGAANPALVSHPAATRAGSENNPRFQHRSLRAIQCLTATRVMGARERKKAPVQKDRGQTRRMGDLNPRGR